ncbi:MAG: phosphoribosylaminoimidazolesuccinocarboxamide synthase [Gammaproteobacteria bacterium]|nr:phosphoribosylaminoimidazolesuccinocarboxamide synthase [Gammaproteobacteria bacterium]
MSEALFESHLDLPLVARGKVRDIYQLDEQHLLFVTTDRISAFDVILPDPIPGKGSLLTQISNFWFEKSSSLIPNHLSHLNLADYVDQKDYELLKDRSVIVKKLKTLPVEAIVRGYLIGSGWKDYQANGSVCGIELPEGLQQAEKLPYPIYTPSTKAEVGDHDINISFNESVDLIGHVLAEQVRETSLALYRLAAEYALERGIIIADTKFEFGLDENGQLVLADEVLTPDSSRFWPKDQYEVGRSPVSFDKQFIRDYLESLDWDKTAPGPKIPQDTLDKTQQKYQEAFEILTRD